MFQSDAEIVSSYVHADDKDMQITILAELNTSGYTDYAVDLTKIDIVRILNEAGVLEDTKAVRKIIIKATKEKRRALFRKFSGVVSDCISTMEHCNAKEQANYLSEIDDIREYLTEEFWRELG